MSLAKIYDLSKFYKNRTFPSAPPKALKKAELLEVPGAQAN